MTDTDPILSIIIPTYNCEHTIHECIGSILGQSFTHYEVIVMDNCSTDGTLNILNGFASANPSVSLTSEPDKGIYDAMNKGIKKAQGTWVFFLGGDDVLYDKNILDLIFTNPKNLAQDVIYGNVIFKYSQERWHGKFDFWKLSQINICHQAIFFKKNVFSRLGLYNCDYKVYADWEYNFRWLPDTRIKKKYLDLAIAIYNEKGFSSSAFDQAFTRDHSAIIARAFQKLSVAERTRHIIERAAQRLQNILMKHSTV